MTNWTYIGETLIRIVGEAVGLATRTDAEETSGTDPLHARAKAGIEGAFHACVSHLQLRRTEATVEAFAGRCQQCFQFHD